MDYIIIFLIALKSHPIFSFFVIITLGFLTPLILPKKIKLHIFTFFFILFSLSFINIIAGHLLTNFLIDKFGINGQGQVVDTLQTSNIFNNEPVLKYNVVIKPSNDDNTITTYCLSSDFNIIRADSLNQQFYPKSGTKFNAKFIKNYPRAFVIIADDNSEYSNYFSNITALKSS